MFDGLSNGTSEEPFAVFVAGTGLFLIIISGSNS